MARPIHTWTDSGGDTVAIFAEATGGHTVIEARETFGGKTHVATVYAPTGADAVALARAVLAAAGDTGHRVVSQAEVEALQHRPADRCFYCATDEEMTAAMEGRPHPTIHMNLPQGACPQFRPAPAPLTDNT